MTRNDPDRDPGRSLARPAVWVPGARFAVLLLAAVLATPPALAQTDERVYFQCPCSLQGDGTTMTVTFGARSYRDSDSGRIQIMVYTDRGQWVGTVDTERSLPADGTLETASYDGRMHRQPGEQIRLELHTGWHNDTVVMEGKVDLSKPFEVENFDFLTDTDGDGVADANERLEGTDPEDPASTPGKSVVDLAVYYTEGFADRYDGDPRARIRHFASHANTVLRDSGVSMEYRLVAMVQIPDPGLEALDMIGLENGRHGADLSLLLEGTDSHEYGNCGYVAVPVEGFAHGYIRRGFPSATMRDDGKCSAAVVSHELGHVLGLGHSHAQDEIGFSYRWARGHAVDGDFHTMMSYSLGDSPRIEVFSDPGATCRGRSETDQPCGVDGDEKEGADSRAGLEAVRFQVARRRNDFEDRDGDGVVDPGDGFPDDPDEWRWDRDGDGELDLFDADDDNDGVADADDPFPLDADEWADADGDGEGDNADPDDDNDAVADTVDLLPHAVTRSERMVLLMPPASDDRREGFVRVANLSPDAGEVRIGAGDADGRRGALTLAIGAGETRHFNSTDLEQGNPDKGLSGGVGPGRGDWRLELSSELDIEVLAYVRTADGFLTSMHDIAPAVGNRHRVPIFNPGSNANQVSVLRIFNPTAQTAEVSITGVDDSGYSPGGGVGVPVPPGAVRSFTAAELESGGDGFDGSLGDGRGKWRLTVESDRRIAVMNLLESPTGHLTNLSTASPHRFDEEQTVPLFPAADPSGPQGFARVVNRTAESGEVRITAFDDAGAEYGPVTLALDAGETAHFNSADLERGNAAKGLSGGVGRGVGDWRLEFAGGLDFEVLAYLRTPGGFVTAMHDAAPAVDGRHWVSVFNPGSNRKQVSRLRLVNPGTEPAEVDVRGVDDGGASPGDVVRTAVPAGAARTFTAAQLEAGADGLEGALGDGAGKWRLMVESRQPLVVMSLLKSPTGHLTNLSTPGAGTASRTFTGKLVEGGEGPEMVAIPRGAFRMGCASDEQSMCPASQWPPREVAITHRFALSTHEVTFAEWDVCVADGACGNRQDYFGRGEQPVHYVTKFDAEEYVTWLSDQTGKDYRLPSEAEWEYAARAGSTTVYSWGDEIGLDLAQCDGCNVPPERCPRCFYNYTVAVGSFTPNVWGLFDMHGNLAELVGDCLNANYEGAPTDGSAWMSGDCHDEIARGGHWRSGPARLGSASRNLDLRHRVDDVGFRIARSLPPAGGAEDADDHGDTAREATAVAVPSTTAGELGFDDKDYFSFELDEAAKLTVEATGTTNTYGTLFDGDASILAETDHGGITANFGIEHWAEAGTYYVEVRGSQRKRGPYELTVETGGELSYCRVDDIFGVGESCDIYSTNLDFRVRSYFVGERGRACVVASGRETCVLGDFSRRNHTLNGERYTLLATRVGNTWTIKEVDPAPPD